MKEYLLSVNSFQRPKILDEKDATYTLLIRLFLLEPGTFQTHPEMGIGLISKYRYADVLDLEKLRTEALNQIALYLPELIATDLYITENDRETNIRITIDNTLYEFTFDKALKTLKDL